MLDKVWVLHQHRNANDSTVYGKEMREGPKPDGSFLGNSRSSHHPYNTLEKSTREQKSLKALLMNSEMKNSSSPQNRALVYKYLHSQIFNNKKICQEGIQCVQLYRRMKYS